MTNIFVQHARSLARVVSPAQVWSYVCLVLTISIIWTLKYMPVNHVEHLLPIAHIVWVVKYVLPAKKNSSSNKEPAEAALRLKDA